MSQLLVVIPFNQGNAALAESLVDSIYQGHGKKAFGHALLVAANEVHAEPREKIKISARLAFAVSEMVQLQKGADIFNVIAQVVSQRYRLPFLWLEPEFKLKPKAIGQIEAAYLSQPKRYFLSKGTRIGVYPNNAFDDLGKQHNEAITNGDSLFQSVGGTV